MKILLTGPAGFIGSHTLDRLLAEGHTVVGIDNFDPFYPREIKTANLAPYAEHPNFTLIEADLSDLTTYTKIKFIAEGLGGQESGDRSQGTGIRNQSSVIKSGGAAFDAIIHLAAKAGVRPSIEDPAGYLQANVVATQHLLDFARDQKIEQFVFASSSSVYGVCPDLPWKENNTDLLPISPYAGTKLSGELLGKVYSHLFGIRFLALRFFTVYGPRQRPDLAIHKFAKRMADGEVIPVFGDGSTSRDYTFVDDTVSGILAAVNYRDSDFEIFNLGNDQTVTLTEMISQIEGSLGIQAKIDRQPEQPGDVPHTWACIEKAKAKLGYQSTTAFPEGMQHFAEWFQAVGKTVNC